MTTVGYLAIAGLYGLVLALVASVVGSIRQAASLRVALAQVGGSIRGLRGEMEALRSEFHAGFTMVRKGMATTAAELARDVSDLRERLVELEH